LVLENVDHIDRGEYTCKLTNDEVTAIDSFISLPHDVILYDSVTGAIFNQIMVEFPSGTIDEDKQPLRDLYQAEVIDSCQCSRELELWELDWALIDSIFYLNVNGDTVYIHDPESVVEGAECPPIPDSLGVVPAKHAEFNLALVDEINAIEIVPTDPIYTAPPIFPINMQNYELVSIGHTDTGVNPDRIGSQYLPPPSLLDCQETEIHNDPYGHGTHLAGIITEDLDPALNPKIHNIQIFDHQLNSSLFNGICGLH